MRNIRICRLLLLCVFILDVGAIALLVQEDGDLALRFFLVGGAVSWLGAAFAIRFYRSERGGLLQRSWWARFLEMELGAAALFCGLTLTIFVGLYILWLLYLLVYIGVFPMILPLIALYFVLCFLTLQFIRMLPFVSLSLISTPICIVLAARKREWWAVAQGGLALLLTGFGLRVLHYLLGEDSEELFSLLESSLHDWQGWPFGLMVGAVVFHTMLSSSTENPVEPCHRHSSEV